MPLKQKIKGALSWNFFGLSLKTALQLIQLSVVARILSPEDLGVMATISVVLGLGSLFADFGLSTAYIQRESIEGEERSSLFWLNCLLGFLFTSIIALSSPLLAIFFDSKNLLQPLLLSSLIFSANAPGQQIRADAEKNLQFKHLSIIEVTASSIGVLLTILSATSGMGVLSLVIGVLGSSIINTVLLWTILSNGWRPQLIFKIKKISSFIKYGGSVIGHSIINQLNMGLDIWIGGHFFGATQLGFYTTPRTLVLQIQSASNTLLNRVSLPLFSSSQMQPERLSRLYIRTLNATCSICAPIYIYLIFNSEEIVRFFLGEKWLDSCQFLQIFSCWAFLRAIRSPAGSLLFGTGNPGLAFKWNFYSFFFLAPLLLIGAIFSLQDLAISLLIFEIILVIPGWKLLVSPISQVTLKCYLTSIFNPVLASLLSIIPISYLALILDLSILLKIVAIFIYIFLYLIFGIFSKNLLHLHFLEIIRGHFKI